MAVTIGDNLPVSHREKSNGFMVINNFEDAKKIATLMVESGIIPSFHYKAKNPVASVLICLQKGLEVGLSPTQAVQDIANIGGRPVVWGDAALGLCKVSPHYEYCKEEFDEKTQTAICTIKRDGEEAVIKKFSMEDAKIAGLLHKDIWKQYPKRMLQMRARGFALRDCFPDVLKGLHLTEEYVGMREVEINPITNTVYVNEESVAEPIEKTPLESIKNRLKAIKDSSISDLDTSFLSDEEDIVSLETHSELIKWMNFKNVSSDESDRWLKKANVATLNQLKETQVKALIDMLISRE